MAKKTGVTVVIAVGKPKKGEAPAPNVPPIKGKAGKPVEKSGFMQEILNLGKKRKVVDEKCTDCKCGKK